VEELEQLRKRIKIVQEENVSMLKTIKEELLDRLYVVRPSFTETLELSTVQILDANDVPVGIGFFVSPKIIVTAYHYIKDHCHSSLHALIASVDGQHINTHTLAFAPNATKYSERCKALDLGLLTVETARPHYLTLYSRDNEHLNSKKSNFAMAFYTMGPKTQRDMRSLGYRFGVMPVDIEKATDNHVVYSCFVFSGETGGAVVSTNKGEVLGLHLQTVNQAREALRKQKKTSPEAAEAEAQEDSVSACIRGLSQGFLALRLDSAEVHALVFGE
jgi:hypothetical protein